MKDEFCQECTNMLYPKEDTTEKTLYMACRNCEHVEPPSNFKLIENVIEREVFEKIDAKEISMDPCVFVAAVECKCGYGVAACFEMKGSDLDRELGVCYVCKRCYNVWM